MKNTSATHPAPRPAPLRVLSELWRRPSGVYALIVLGILLFAAAVSVFWTPYPPNMTNTSVPWQSPSAQYLLGTDWIGRDIFSQMLTGSGITVMLVLGVAFTAATVGIALAALSALTRKWLREVFAVIIDVLIAFPTLLVAIMLAAVFGGSLGVVVAAVGISAGVNIARVSKAEIARVISSEYVLAAQASGVSPLGILRKHIVPNIAPAFIVQLTFAMGIAILAEAGLSYLGYGAPFEVSSWGRVLAGLQNYIGPHPGIVLIPGFAMTATVLAFNLLGDALREAADPRLQRSGADRDSDLKRQGSSAAHPGESATPQGVVG